MRNLFITSAIGLGLGAVTFLPQIQELRDDKAYEYVQQGELIKAKWLYLHGKLLGNQKATNNFHVLKYRLIRDDKAVSKQKRITNRKKASLAFDKLAKKGFVPAVYNAGMFHYRRKVGSVDYENGLRYFDYATSLGDEMSSYAADMMRAGAHEKDRKYLAFRKSADKGNGWAAYRYAKNLRFDKDKLKYAEKYALMGAQAGYPDAQEFLASYFPRRDDVKVWLEQAATNENNRSLSAARDLADLADKDRDFETKRQWLTVASTPREPFKYQILVEPEGLRWRGLQNSINADANTTQSSAYELALMQLDGIGGPVDKDGAIKSLEYADYWSDAELLLTKLRSQGAPATSKPRLKAAKVVVDENLKKFDSQKNYPFYSKLRSLVESKHIRYATRTDLKKYANGVSKMYNNEKNGFRDWGDVEDCSIGTTCFYLDAPIILPGDMFGAHSATFIVSPAVILPKQHVSHNKYIFMNELNVP